MLVTLEGLDGSGKTTVWEALRERYAGTFTREPTTSWYGDAVRRSLASDDADPLAELFLYTADHADHLRSTVRPALADGALVVSDRYVDSRYAYQAATLDGVIDDPLDYVQSVHEPFTRLPDLTLYLDIEPEAAVERSAEANKFEQLEHLRAVREHYERVIADDPERFARIDATADPAAVLDAAVAAIENVADRSLPRRS